MVPALIASLGRLAYVEIDPISQPNDLHILSNNGAAGHYRLFLIAVLQPDLAIETLAIPAKVAVAYTLHRQKLKAAEQGIILGHHVLAAEDVDLDKTVIGLKYIG